MEGAALPVVSGISPREGPPGTKVTIRGENLGINVQDVIALTIHGQSCLGSLEYVSSKKLICQTGNAVGPGKIIVSTLSGGDGTCTVTFVGVQREATPLLDPLDESDVWMEEDLEPLAIPGYSLKSQGTPLYQRKVMDPMGLSRDEARGGKKRPSGDNLEEMFPHGSGSLQAFNFNPAWYLLERHRFTSFDDLKLGLKRLESEVRRSEQAPVEYMRDNLDAFLQCYDTLSDVNELKIRNESESQGGSLTDSVEDLLKDSVRQAEELFQGVLKCKSRADATRNALTVLQRYRFLFNLPKSIDNNIKNGEYDIVTNDYERAKSLFAGTRVNVFKKVLEEVEKKIENFRRELSKKLHVLPSTLEDQRKLIKYLLELDCDGDPAWECITNMHKWMLRLLFNSKEEFQGIVHAPGEHTGLPPGVAEVDGPALPPRGRGHARTVSDISWVSSASSSTPAARSQEGRTGRELYPGSKDSSRPNRILFVEELTGLISESLPDFWRLGQAYLSRSLFQGVIISESHHILSQAHGGHGHKDMIENMVLEVVEIYVDMVNSSLFTDAYNSLSKSRKERLGEWVPFEDTVVESSGAWLPQIVRQISECVNSLQSLSLPARALDVTRHLSFNVRTLCADTLFHRAARDIEVLHEREDWRIHAEEGGVITSLPILFENMVVEVLLTLKEIVIETHPGETESDIETLQQSSLNHFHALLEHFSGCFDYLAFQQEDDLHEESISMIGRDALPTGDGVAEEPASDERLLMIMSNLSYVMTEVVPRLFDCFVTHGYPQCPEVEDAVMAQYQELDSKVFREYIQRKSESLVPIPEQGMQMGFFDWEQCGQPEGVRGYIKEVLMSLVQVHAEVYAVSPQIVPRVLCHLVELLTEEMARLLTEVEAFGANGVLYAYIELTVLKESLSAYVTDASHKHFRSCQEHLGEMDRDSSLVVKQVVKEFRRGNELQLRCFTAERDLHQLEPGR